MTSMTPQGASEGELPAWRRRVARVCLAIAAVIGFLMLLALPMDAWILAGRREEHMSLAILLAVVIASLWAWLALGRRGPTGQRLAWVLGAYSAITAGTKAVGFAGLPESQRSSDLISALVISGAMVVALMVAALVCIPSRRFREVDSTMHVV